MSALDYDGDEPTQRTLLELTPTPSQMPQAIAHVRWGAIQARRERAALRKWAMGVIVAVVTGSLTVAMAVGRYIERVDAATTRLERMEQRMDTILEGSRDR